MKTKRNISHIVAAVAVVLSFAFSMPVFSGGPFSTHGYPRPSAELRPVFVQLAGQAAKARASLKYNACEYGMNDMEGAAFAEVTSNLERSAQQIEKSLVYQAPTPAEIRTGDEETDLILSQLQDMGRLMESTIAYVAPELNI